MGMMLVALALTYFSTSWVVWTVVMFGMLIAFGPRHPRTEDEHVPLDRTRLVLALLALAMFILCFTPAPIESIESLRR
jgi:membrane-associated protease RseP (regulator of RpoE activity)